MIVAEGLWRNTIAALRQANCETMITKEVTGRYGAKKGEP